jgi:hypothetical protein
MSDELSYSFKASSFGAPWEFTLKPAGLEWSVGMRTGLLRYSEIRQVRLSFRPVTMQSYRFQTEIWSPDMPKISIASTSWRGIVEQTRQDEPYRAFVVELHRRIAAAGARAQFAAGISSIKYWFGLVMFIVIAPGLAALTVRAMRLNEWGAAALVGGFFVLFVWQVGNFFRRNRPGIYTPDNVPESVLPSRAK